MTTTITAPATRARTVARPAGAPAGNRAVAKTGYPAAIWLLLAGNLVVRAAGFAYPFLAYHVAGQGHAAGAVARRRFREA